MKLNSDLLGLHAAVLLLGMTGLFGKFLDLNPAAIICGRTFFTSVFLLLCIVCMKKSLQVHSSNNLLLLLISGIVLSLHWYVFFHSIQISTVAIGVIGFSTFPVFVTFLEPIVFGERYRLLDIVSGAVVFIGLCVVAPKFNFSHGHTLALYWAVLSGFLLALFTLINRKLIRKNHFLAITFYQNVVAFFCALPFALFFKFLPMTRDYWVLALLGVVFTAIPQALLVRGLKVVRAQVASVLVGLEPVYSIIFAVILLNEIPQLSTIVGGLIVAGAVILAARSHKNIRPDTLKSSVN